MPLPPDGFVPKNWRLAFLVAKPEDRESVRSYAIAKRVTALSRSETLSDETARQHYAAAEAWADEWVKQ